MESEPGRIETENEGFTNAQVEAFMSLYPRMQRSDFAEPDECPMGCVIHPSKNCAKHGLGWWLIDRSGRLYMLLPRQTDLVERFADPLMTQLRFYRLALMEGLPVIPENIY